MDKKERIGRATSIIHECIMDKKMTVNKLEKLADIALDILYPSEKEIK